MTQRAYCSATAGSATARTQGAWSADDCLFPVPAEQPIISAVDVYTPIEVAISTEQIVRAKLRHEQFQKTLEASGRQHLKNSIEEGRGSFVGLLGEEVVHDFFSIPNGVAWTRTPENHPFDYDLKLRVAPHITVDVKTKKQECPRAPEPHYFATVCHKNTHQKCDLYMFVRVHSSQQKAWILGCLPKVSFLTIARLYYKGQLDPTSHCGWTFKEDCLNLPISDLWQPTSVTELLSLWALLPRI